MCPIIFIFLLNLKMRCSNNSSYLMYLNSNWWASLITQLSGEICLQCRRPRVDSWVIKIPWRRDRLPTPVFLGLPGGLVVKNLPASAGDTCSIPGLGTKIPHATEQLSPRATTREAICHTIRACPLGSPHATTQTASYKSLRG